MVSAAPFLSARPRPLLLAGSTAVGKSEIALTLAEIIQGEIISADSMQVYRGLDLGTAKPSAAERERVPHHLIDLCDLNESFDAARFSRLAQAAGAAIQARGHVPIICGGTGLYFQALTRGLGDAPPGNAALRAELEAIPLPELLVELAEKDPATLETIDRNNPRRVIRAVEVIRLTGKPYSTQRSDWRGQGQSLLAFGVSRASADLKRRIDQRVERMFARGLVSETESLLKRGLAENETAMQALGYRQVVEHLAGKRSLPATIELVKIRTRQFARRQMTWFRRQLVLQWISLGADADVGATARMLADLYAAPAGPEGAEAG